MQYLLAKNILWGNALTLKTVDDDPNPIVFSEWSPVNGSQIKRRDFNYRELIHKTKHRSDLGEDSFIEKLLKDYPLIHFLKLQPLDSLNYNSDVLTCLANLSNAEVM